MILQFSLGYNSHFLYLNGRLNMQASGVPNPRYCGKWALLKWLKGAIQLMPRLHYSFFLMFGGFYVGIVLLYSSLNLGLFGLVSMLFGSFVFTGLNGVFDVLFTKKASLVEQWKAFGSGICFKGSLISFSSTAIFIYFFKLLMVLVDAYESYVFPLTSLGILIWLGCSFCLNFQAFGYFFKNNFPMFSYEDSSIQVEGFKKNIHSYIGFIGLWFLLFSLLAYFIPLVFVMLVMPFVFALKRCMFADIFEGGKKQYLEEAEALFSSDMEYVPIKVKK